MLICQNPSCGNPFEPKPSTRGKYCSLSCGTIHRNILTKAKKLDEYTQNPARCMNCGNALAYESKKNKFCSSSCSGTYTNARKDWTKIRTGPKPSGIKKLRAPKMVACTCVICDSDFTGNRKTCSPECFSKLVSSVTIGRAGGNRDLNKPGIDCAGNTFYYDSGWEVILAESLNANNIFWTRPERFILSDGRSYSPDFYLPDYGVYLDPKAKRPGYYRKSMLKIEMFEQEFNTRCLVVSDPKLLSWDHVQTMMLVGNNRS